MQHNAESSTESFLQMAHSVLHMQVSPYQIVTESLCTIAIHHNEEMKEGFSFKISETRHTV